MLGSAFAGAATAAVTGSAWVGLGAGILTSVALSLLHGYACITHRGNQVISGLAINILVAGLAPTPRLARFARGGHTPQHEHGPRSPTLTLPYAPRGTDLTPPGLHHSPLPTRPTTLPHAP